MNLKDDPALFIPYWIQTSFLIFSNFFCIMKVFFSSSAMF